MRGTIPTLVPVQLTIGHLDPQTIGEVEIPLELGHEHDEDGQYVEPGTVTVYVTAPIDRVRFNLAALLRAAADEIEHPSHGGT